MGGGGSKTIFGGRKIAPHKPSKNTWTVHVCVLFYTFSIVLLKPGSQYDPRTSIALRRAAIALFTISALKASVAPMNYDLSQ